MSAEGLHVASVVATLPHPKALPSVVHIPQRTLTLGSTKSCKKHFKRTLGVGLADLACHGPWAYTSQWECPPIPPPPRVVSSGEVVDKTDTQTICPNGQLTGYIPV